jgi:hypothetical protein
MPPRGKKIDDDVEFASTGSMILTAAAASTQAPFRDAATTRCPGNK